MSRVPCYCSPRTIPSISCRILCGLHSLIAGFVAAEQKLHNRSPKCCCYKSCHHATVLGVVSKNDEFVELKLSLHRAYLVQYGAYRAAWLVTRTLVLCAIESHC
jgi:hypothetical protein